MILEVARWVVVGASLVGFARQLIHLGWRGLWGDVPSFIYLTLALYAAGSGLSGVFRGGLLLFALLALARGAYLQDRRNRQNPGRAA